MCPHIIQASLECYLILPCYHQLLSYVTNPTKSAIQNNSMSYQAKYSRKNDNVGYKVFVIVH